MLRLFENEDYDRYKQVFINYPDFINKQVFVQKYGNSENLVIVDGDIAFVFRMISLTEYQMAKLYLSVANKIDQIDYNEYSLNLRGVPKFINNSSHTADIIFTVNDTNLVQYLQHNTETGARVILEFIGVKKNGFSKEDFSGKEPAQIYFQNKAKEDYEPQKFTGGGMGFTKDSRTGKYTRIFGMNGDKPVVIPLISKSYDYEYIKQMIKEGNFNVDVPSSLLELYEGDILSSYFELSFELQRVQNPHKSVGASKVYK